MIAYYPARAHFYILPSFVSVHTILNVKSQVFRQSMHERCAGRNDVAIPRWLRGLGRHLPKRHHEEKVV